ncbi:MAG: glycosyltransferase [Microbacterium sp.]|nr:glycosyltransferase [Microbacterium sp.]
MHLEIVCEWIEATGGAEKVLDAMIEAYPGAPVHALWNDAPARMQGVDVRESWMARTPLRDRKALALPFFDPTWRRRTAVGTPDKVLVSSYVFAHHVRFRGRPDAPAYAYVHSPARYIWAPEIDERGRSPLVRATAPYWKSLDRRRAAEVHSIAANSAFVQQRILDSWGRESRIIHPPVDTAEITEVPDWRERLDAAAADLLGTLPDAFVLGASRLVPYKRLDAVLEFAASVGLPAVIVGSGPDRPRLEQLAVDRGIRAHFLGAVSTPLLYALYQRATVFVFPPVEDFGIVPVEAMAAGARVIVNAVGGTAESVRHGVGGVQARRFAGEDAWAALDRALRLDRRAVPQQAARFARSEFISNLRAWVDGD